MNLLDWILLLVIAGSIVGGLLSGFTRLAIGLAATLLGIFFGFWFYHSVADQIGDYVTSRPAANLIGFFLIFLGIILLGSIVSRIVARFFRMVGLSWLDRLMGGAFGFVRGVLITMALLTAFLAFAPNPPPRFVVNSRVAPYLVDASAVLAAVTPSPIRNAFRETKQRVQRIWSGESGKRLKQQTV